MAKRRRTTGGSVTGGTGDVKPQILTLESGIAAAGDDYVTQEVALPVPRFGNVRNRSTVFEFLKVDWYLGLGDSDNQMVIAGYLSTVQTRVNAETSTILTLQADVLNNRVFAFAMMNRAISTNGGQVNTWPISIDLTDNNGNGILVATDKIHVTMGGVDNTAALGSAICKVYYRLVNVGVTEYVGIVQSQQ